MKNPKQCIEQREEKNRNNKKNEVMQKRKKKRTNPIRKRTWTNASGKMANAKTFDSKPIYNL